jgi:hypothetical protein
MSINDDETARFRFERAGAQQAVSSTPRKERFAILHHASRERTGY